jgi:hypothetical protein
MPGAEYINKKFKVAIDKRPPSKFYWEYGEENVISTAEKRPYRIDNKKIKRKSNNMRIAKVLLFLVGLSVLVGGAEQGGVVCPIDNCSCWYTGKVQWDEYGHLYQVWSCGCCGREWAVK